MGTITHGHTRIAVAGRRSPTWITWRGMLQRCYSPGNASFKNYGARGIAVCDRWHKFSDFLADMGERPEGMTLDRIDPNGNYEPRNCRWATWTEQRQNRRPNSVCRNGHARTPENIFVDARGVRLCRTCYVRNYEASNRRVAEARAKARAEKRAT